EVRALREAQGDALAEDEAVAGFDRAGRQRADALAAADDLAKALADSKSKRAVSLDELRRALLSVQKAQESEQRLSRDLSRSGRSTGAPLARQRRTPATASRSNCCVEATVGYLSNDPCESTVDYVCDSWGRLVRDEVVSQKKSRDALSAGSRRSRRAAGSSSARRGRCNSPATGPRRAGRWRRAGRDSDAGSRLPARWRGRRRGRPGRRPLSAPRPAGRCAGAGRRVRRRSPSSRAG